MGREPCGSDQALAAAWGAQSRPAVKGVPSQAEVASPSSCGWVSPCWRLPGRNVPFSSEAKLSLGGTNSWRCQLTAALAAERQVLFSNRDPGSTPRG